MKALRYITAAAALITLAACTNDEVDVGGFANDPDAVRINATVGNPFTKSYPTEAIGEANATKFAEGDQLKVSVPNQEAVAYTLTNGAWTPEANKYLKWQTNTQTFTAYFPADYTPNKAVLTDQSSNNSSDANYIGKSDYMFVESTLSKPTTAPYAITLQMVRQTARIVIEDITWNDQYKDAQGSATHKITAITINNIKPCEQDGKYYALLNPVESAKTDEPFIKLTIESTAGGASENLTIKGIPALTAGSSYTYSIAIGKNHAAIQSVAVEDWATGSIIANDAEGPTTEETTPTPPSSGEEGGAQP